jgi:hypothetical protein
MRGIILGRIRNYKERQQKKVKLWWLSVNPELLKLDYVIKKKEDKVF